MHFDGGTFLTSRAEESCNYKKSSARKSRGLDTSGYSRLRCKPTAPQRAVGLSRRADRFGGRVHPCDTTTMHATTRRHEARRKSIRNPSYVHPVHPLSIWVDANNRQTAARFLSYVQASTPNCNVHAELKQKVTLSLLSTYKRYADWGGRLDVTASPPVTSCDYLRPPKLAEGGRGGRVSDEVTL